jgi:hypothetical protein
MPDATLGLLRRSSSDHIAVLGGLAVGDNDAVLNHAVNRDGVEEYRVIVANGLLKVYDNDTGAERTVVMQPGADAYLTAADGFRAVTAGDVTFITNRNKIVRKGARLSPSRAPEAIVYFRQTDYSTKYTLTLDGTDVVYDTPAGSTSALEGIKTDLSARALAGLIDTKLGFSFNARVIGSSIYLTKKTGEDFKVAVSDGVADRGLRVVKSQVQRFEDLPFRAVEGMVVKVAGDAGTVKDDYYVVFSADNADAGNGLWRECPKPGTLLDLNPATMPHILRRNGPTLEDIDALSAPQLVYLDGQGIVASPDIVGSPFPFGSIVNVDGRGATIPVGVVSPNPRSIRCRVTLNIETMTARPWLDLTCDYAFKYRGELVTSVRVPAGASLSEVIEIPLSSFGARPVAPGFVVRLFALTDSGLPGGEQAAFLRTVSFTVTDIEIEGEGSTLMVLEPTVVYPAGYTITVRSRSPVTPVLLGTYTSLSAMTGTALVTAFATAVDGQGGLSLLDGILGNGQLRITSLTPQVTVVGEMPLNHVRVSNPGGADLSTFVGRKLVNLTTGAFGTITAYLAPYFVAVLGGAARSTALTTDDIAIFQTGDYFVFGPNKWAPRGAGDDITVPFPSFTDRRVAGVFVWQNRLGILSEDRVICSEADSYGNFFKVSAVALLDSDVVDLQSSLPEIAYFSAAVTIRGLLYLASDNGIHVLEGNPALTPTSAYLKRVTAQPCSRNCEPVASGDFLFFASGNEGVTHVSMLRVRDANQPALAELLTLKIPGYLVGNPLKLAAAPNLRRIFLLTDSGTAVYLFAYAEAANGDLAQAAWCKWIFPDRVKSIDVLQETLGVVLLHPDSSVSLNRVSLERQPYN